MDILYWIFSAVIGFFVVIALVLFVYIKLQGEADVRILTSERSALVCDYIDKEKAVFSMTIPFYNGGKQEDIILDAFARVLLPQEQFDLAKVTARLEHVDRRRSDDYLEAFIVKIKQKGDFVLTLTVEAKEGITIQEVLKDIVDITIDVYWTAVGRRAPRILKDDLTVLLEEFQDSAAKEAKR